MYVYCLGNNKTIKKKKHVWGKKKKKQNMFDRVFLPDGQSDTDIEQEATFDSLPGMILYADQDTLGQLGPGEDILP